MKPTWITFLIILTACYTPQAQQPLKPGQTLTFSLSNHFKDLPELFRHQTSSEAALQQLTKAFQKQVDKEAQYPNELYLTITDDGWTSQRFSSNEYSYLSKRFFRNDSSLLYDKYNNELMGSSRIKLRTCDYTIEINKRKKKTIHGYPCYYVKVTKISADTTSRNAIGDIVYELYVTEQIALPMEALVRNDCDIPGFFPLEVTEYPSKSRKNKKRYKLVRIE